MENLKIIPDLVVPTKDMINRFAEKNYINRGYRWWTCSEAFENKIWTVSEDGTMQAVSATAEAEIVPIISFDTYNLLNSSFCLNDRFFLKGLQFKIVSLNHAICLSSIGNTQFSDKEYWKWTKTTIYDVTKDWFDYWITDAEITFVDRIPALHKLYQPHKTSAGDWEILNSKKQRHIINGRRFYDSFTQARESMFQFYDTHPIPQEDIDAFYTL